MLQSSQVGLFIRPTKHYAADQLKSNYAEVFLQLEVVAPVMNHLRLAMWDRECSQLPYQVR